MTPLKYLIAMMVDKWNEIAVYLYSEKKDKAYGLIRIKLAEIRAEVNHVRFHTTGQKTNITRILDYLEKQSMDPETNIRNPYLLFYYILTYCRDSDYLTTSGHRRFQFHLSTWNAVLCDQLDLLKKIENGALS